MIQFFLVAEHISHRTKAEPLAVDIFALRAIDCLSTKISPIHRQQKNGKLSLFFFLLSAPKHIKPKVSEEKIAFMEK